MKKPFVLIAAIVAVVGVCAAVAVAQETSATADQTKRAIDGQEARERTETYARIVCVNHQRCKDYSAGQCLRRGGGVSCKAHNFLLSKDEKFNCRRRVLPKGRGANRRLEFLGPWKCHRGWPPEAVDRRARSF